MQIYLYNVQIAYTLMSFTILLCLFSISLLHLYIISFLFPSLLIRNYYITLGLYPNFVRLRVEFVNPLVQEEILISFIFQCCTCVVSNF